jgi:hypothetical protein
MIATRYEAKPKTGACVAYHAKNAIKRSQYTSPKGLPPMTKEERIRAWYHYRWGKHGNGYVIGLTKAEKALIRQGAIVYLYAVSRGVKRLFVVDCSRNVGRTDARGHILSYTWRYFARKPFIEEITRLYKLGVKLDAKTWAGFTK